MTKNRVLMAAALVLMSTIAGAQIVENFDGVTVPNLPAGWVAQTVIAGGTPFATVNTASQTPPNSVFSDNPGTVSDQVLVSPAFAISSTTASISFQHARDLESTFDGAVLEVAINGGAFQDILATGATFGANGYNAAISNAFGSPIGNRQAWTGSSGAGTPFVLTSVTLPATANGQSWVFRFRRATDNSVARVGFWVDSFTATIAGTQDMAISLAGLPGAATVGVPYSGSFTCTNVGGVAASAGTLCSISGLPAGLSQGSCTISPSAAAWVAGNAVPVAEVVTCAVAGTPSSVTAATVTGTTGTTGDVNTVNDTASMPLAVIAAQDMAVDLTGLPGTATVGVPYSGSFTCTNVGGTTASAGTLCSVSGLPAGLSQGACTISPSAAAWVPGNAVPAGAVVTCLVSGTPSSVTAATVTGSTGATGDTNVANNTATKSINTLAAQDMAVDLTGLPSTATVGVPYSGSFTCANVGGTTASAGTLCSVSGLPAGLSQGSCTISPSAAAWVAGNAVPVGAVVTCALAGTPTTAGSLTVTGTTGATGDTNVANNTASLSLTTGAPKPIPTLSEWALIFLSGLIGLFGVAGVRRRRH